MNSISFTEYIKQNYDNDIYNKVSSFVVTHKNSIDWQSSKVEDPSCVEVQDVAIKHVYPVDQPGMFIQFHVHVQANVTLQQNSYRYDSEYETVNPWFTVLCTATIGEKSLEDFRIVRVEPFSNLSKLKGHLSDNLVPILYKEQYDKEAQEFLNACGMLDKFRNPSWIDPAEVARKLGLKYRELALTGDRSVLGRIYMYGSDVKLYNWDKGDYDNEPTHIEAGTLVIDPYADEEMPEGARNNTIIHECYHWLRHRKAFALFRICNPDISSIEYMREFHAVDESDAVIWMERQARAMAPRILMPSVAFKVKTEELIKVIKDLEPNATYVEWLQFVVTELSKFFHTSTISVQIRLIEMGYTQAIGINNWVDGHWVPAHSVYRAESIEPTQTFTISDGDALYQSVVDPELRKLLETGQYVYVENHFVRNSDAYITWSETGRMMLTPYARSHMEECAIIFNREVLSGKHYDNDAILFCALNKNSKFGIQMGLKLAAAPDKITPKEMMEYKAYIKEIDEVVAGMTNRFKDRVKAAIKYSELSQESIGINCDLSRQTISEYANKDNPKITEDSLLQLCIGMSSPYQICKALWEKAPCQIVDPQKRMAYESVMVYMTFHTIAEVNRFLKNCGLEPIGEHKFLKDVYRKEIK